MSNETKTFTLVEYIAEGMAACVGAPGRGDLQRHRATTALAEHDADVRVRLLEELHSALDDVLGGAK